MNRIEQSFQEICDQPTVAEAWYLSLYARVPFYGGPEEGGWWGNDVVLQEYQRFHSKQDAETAESRVAALVKQMDGDARRAWGEQCLRELDQAEAHGLEPSDLRETDGPTEFFCVVEQTPGQHESRGCRHYE